MIAKPSTPAQTKQHTSELDQWPRQAFLRSWTSKHHFHVVLTWLRIESGGCMKPEAPNPNTIVWFQNRFVRLGEANVNILTHALNYGTGVFEGIRGYYDEKEQELYLVRAREHYERWKRNAAILRIEIPRTAEELAELTAELCRRNEFRSH